jgi:hypothetical protein
MSSSSSLLALERDFYNDHTTTCKLAAENPNNQLWVLFLKQKE